MAAPPRLATRARKTNACRKLRRAWAARAARVCGEKDRAGMFPHGEGPRSVNRGQEATRSAIEHVTSVLPWSVLTETSQSLHVAPHRARIRFVLFRQRVRLGGLLLRQIESPHNRLEHRVARRSEFLGGGPQDQGAVIRGVCVVGCANAVVVRRPRLLHLRSYE